jgi:hypothetical protein
VHFDVRNRGLDLRHMAADALATRGAGRMMSVPRNVRGPWAIGGCRAVTLQAKNGGRLEKIRIVLRAVDVVATEAGHAVRVHQTGNEIISLHTVSASSAVRIISGIGAIGVTVGQRPELS